MILTAPQLASAAGARIDRAQAFLPHVIEALQAYAIDTPQRVAAFLSQIGHESGGLRYTTELWGPTEAQERYERDMTAEWPPAGRADRNWKPFHLGNRYAGDGYRYRGHGLIQTTGRTNHARARDRLRARFGAAVPDFEVDPDALAQPRWAALSAGDYWDDRQLNALADIGAYQSITRRINGGLNGYADRLARYETAMAVFA